MKRPSNGQAVDYDFGLDVGLIRIRPGRRLPAARVVPAHWEPRSRMKMLTVGCSEGHDATAWHTLIVNPRMKGLSGNASYQAIECMIAPKQGRSGGGLFTTDGYVAGVCNFAEPRGDHGLYATPRSIYAILDRNNMMALYEPVTRGKGALLADRGERPAGRYGDSGHHRSRTIARSRGKRERSQSGQARRSDGSSSGARGDQIPSDGTSRAREGQLNTPDRLASHSRGTAGREARTRRADG